MRMVVLCPYPFDRAPSQRLKFEQYYDDWRAAGWEVDLRPFWDEAAWKVLHRPGRLVPKTMALVRGFRRRLKDVADATRADLVYVHLDVAPVGPPWFERRLLRSGVPVVYDIDDLVHLPHGSRGNSFMRWLRGQARVTSLVRGAAHVVVGTPVLETWARRHNEHVTDISSTVDTDRYLPANPYDNRRRLTLGWSGSHSTSPYLHLLDGVLRELRLSGLDFRLKVIGDPNFRIEGVDVEAQAWRLETEVMDLQEIDIGLYPLPDEEWVLGKSGGKALQYMALGIPTVATDIGAARRIIHSGENGYLVRDAAGWRAALLRLAEDPTLRARLGRAGRKTVVQRFSVQANRNRFREVLAHAFGQGGTS